MSIQLCSVSVDLAGRRIVDSVGLSAGHHEMVAVLGPNGSGKSTLLRAVYRALRPADGTVVVAGHDVWAGSARESALRTAAVRQDEMSEFEFSVYDTVQLGRVPHRGRLRPDRAADADSVCRAMELAGVVGLADRPINTLSGGERQRVHVARALAQQTPLIVLDEPTNHLDIWAQLELLTLLRHLPITVVAALHDLNLAAAFCDRLFLLAAGRVVIDGPPATVLTPEVIARVYQVRAHVDTNPLTGRVAVHLAHPILSATPR